MNQYSTRNATVRYTNNFGLTWNIVYETYSPFKGKSVPMEVDINLDRADMVKEKYGTMSLVNNWNHEQKMKHLEQTNQKKAKELADKKAKKEEKIQLTKRMNSLNS